MKRVLLFFALFALSQSLFAQKLQYEIFLMGKKIGDVSLSKSHGEHGERYLMSSESSAKVLFVKQDSKVNFDVLYKGGSMIKSLYISEKKDDNITTKVNKENSIYKVLYNDKPSHVKEHISFSSILLYFKEPVGVNKVFVERIGDFLPLKKTAAGEYEYLQPDGTRSIYRYHQGKLKEIELKRSMGSVYIRPV